MPEQDMTGQLPGDRKEIKKNIETSPAERILNNAIAKTFSTPAGEVTLKWLRDTTIEKPAMMITKDALAGVLAGYAREGENSLVRRIEKKIKAAKKQ